MSDTYLTKTSVISSDSVVGLTANLTNLTNNKADSNHQHLISNITDSIPFSRITGAPAGIDTSNFILTTNITSYTNYIDTNSADKRYLSINADTMNADWNKIINKPNIITDSSSFATLSILN
ncbi:hypothetical protein KA977_08670, partial [Candidatus Dependentiae bacterium]|nr:hypothetical protein [Candidatus Dependentiae bacterium]